jgi:phosphoglycerol transferase MdoB-like AlkP superfamily enzyme
VIAIYGDHHALNCEDEANNLFMSEYLGHNYDYDEMLNVPLIIHVPGGNINGMDSIIGGQVDFAPTLLNIMGIEAENTYFCGKDLNNSEEGFAILGFPLAEGSYVDDDGFFIMSQDSSLEEKAAKYDSVMQQISVCNGILEKNMIKELTKKK